MRGAGVIVPVFSLRSENGLGVGEFLDLIPLADWAEKAGLSMIQILPVHDTSATGTWRDSYPYSPISAFALHPIYLRLDAIGSLPNELQNTITKEKQRLEGDTLDYEGVLSAKNALLEKIFSLFADQHLQSVEFTEFFNNNAYWLCHYALFCALRDHFGTAAYPKWPKHSQITDDEVIALSESSEHRKRVRFYYFCQFHLHQQFAKASAYLLSKGIFLKGDFPVGVNRYSVEIWRYPKFFHTDRTIGAPPDYFNASGQNWGFPTYNWDEMKKEDYRWFCSRLQQMENYFQAVRLDHILGFFRIWEVPAHCIRGTLGNFRPALPLTRKELSSAGFSDLNRLLRPYLPAEQIEEFDEIIIDVFFEKKRNHYVFVSDTEKEIVSQLTQLVENGKLTQKQAEELRAKLFTLIANVLFVEDLDDKQALHPRFDLELTSSFNALTDQEKEKLKQIYHDYFFVRQEDVWTQEALDKLSVFKRGTKMLICAEDLGFVPACVPSVMEKLDFLVLYIQRMPKNAEHEFGIPQEYIARSVCSPSNHDISTLRAWWEENKEGRQRFYEQILHKEGKAPEKALPEICKKVIEDHLESPSMWALFLLQDLLAIDKSLCSPDPEQERINDPANPEHYWNYRHHLSLEELLLKDSFARELRSLVDEGKRVSDTDVASGY